MNSASVTVLSWLASHSSKAVLRTLGSGAGHVFKPCYLAIPLHTSITSSKSIDPPFKPMFSEIYLAMSSMASATSYLSSFPVRSKSESECFT